jgi:ABC-type molybdate transport system ATPase subunit
LSIHIAVHLPGAPADHTLETAVDAGEILAIVGAEAADRTTFMRIVAGLSRTARGQIIVAGRQVLASQQRVDLPAHRRGIAYIPADCGLFRNMSVRDNLLFGARRRGIVVSRDRFADLSDSLGIAVAQSATVQNLDPSQALGIALGRALLSAPSAIVIAESMPVGPPIVSRRVLRGFRAHLKQQAVPCIVATASLACAASIADRVVTLDRGLALADTPIRSMNDRDLWYATSGEACAILDATVIAVDAAAGLATLGVGDLRLSAGAADFQVGEYAGLQIDARAIEIHDSIAGPEGRESWPRAIVLDCDQVTEAGAAIVRLAIAGHSLVAHLERSVAADHDLFPGKQVFLCITRLSFRA